MTEEKTSGLTYQKLSPNQRGVFNFIFGPTFHKAINYIQLLMLGSEPENRLKIAKFFAEQQINQLQKSDGVDQTHQIACLMDACFEESFEADKNVRFRQLRRSSDDCEKFWDFMEQSFISVLTQPIDETRLKLTLLYQARQCAYFYQHTYYKIVFGQIAMPPVTRNFSKAEDYLLNSTQHLDRIFSNMELMVNLLKEQGLEIDLQQIKNSFNTERTQLKIFDQQLKKDAPYLMSNNGVWAIIRNYKPLILFGLGMAVLGFFAGLPEIAVAGICFVAGMEIARIAVTKINNSNKTKLALLREESLFQTTLFEKSVALGFRFSFEKHHTATPIILHHFTCSTDVLNSLEKTSKTEREQLLEEVGALLVKDDVKSHARLHTLGLGAETKKQEKSSLPKTGVKQMQVISQPLQTSTPAKPKTSSRIKTATAVSVRPRFG